MSAVLGHEGALRIGTQAMAAVQRGGQQQPAGGQRRGHLDEQHGFQ
jgi:hypothetical protein